MASSKSNGDMFDEIIAYVSKRGYRYDANRDFVGAINGRIVYSRHIPIIFRGSFLKAAFGGEYRRVGHEAFDIYLDGGNPLEFLLDLIYAKEHKTIKPKEVHE